MHKNELFFDLVFLVTPLDPPLSLPPPYTPPPRGRSIGDPCLRLIPCNTIELFQQYHHDTLARWSHSRKSVWKVPTTISRTTNIYSCLSWYVTKINYIANSSLCISRCYTRVTSSIWSMAMSLFSRSTWRLSKKRCRSISSVMVYYYNYFMMVILEKFIIKKMPITPTTTWTHCSIRVFSRNIWEDSSKLNTVSIQFWMSKLQRKLQSML